MISVCVCVCVRVAQATGLAHAAKRTLEREQQKIIAAFYSSTSSCSAVSTWTESKAATRWYGASDNNTYI